MGKHKNTQNSQIKDLEFHRKSSVIGGITVDIVSYTFRDLIQTNLH